VELKEIKPTAEVTFETAAGELRFEVEYVAKDRIALDHRWMKLSDKVRVFLAEAIVAWNLAHDDGTPWECDAATKGKLLPQLVALPIKAKRDAAGKEIIPDGVLLGIALFEFVQNEGNFLKN